MAPLVINTQMNASTKERKKKKIMCCINLMLEGHTGKTHRNETSFVMN